VIQPTSLCNIACTYCYLPHKSERRLLSDEVLASVVGTVRDWAEAGRAVEILWHCGEPLTTGPARFRELLGAPWPSGTVHRIQTNATLVNDAWCDLFEEFHPQIGRGDSPALRLEELLARPVDPFPTVQYDGEVTVISPDLSGFVHPELGAFTVGNVLRTPLDRLLASAAGVPWVRQTLEGVSACRSTCEYAAGCGGAWPSNKWFENNDLRSTTTHFCQALHQAPFEGAIYASAHV
jgi:sulfatase maturation enzyme AslB (radical SAM superfamily)